VIKHLCITQLDLTCFAIYSCTAAHLAKVDLQSFKRSEIVVELKTNRSFNRQITRGTIVIIADETDLHKSVGVRFECYLIAVVRPRAKDEIALLLVERKMFYVDGTRAFVYCAGDPHQVASVVNENIRLKLHLEFPVSADNQKQTIFVTLTNRTQECIN